MPSWGWFLIFGCFFLGLCLGLGVGVLMTGTANGELAQHNLRLVGERDSALSTVTELRSANGRLERLVGAVTEDVAS